MQILNKALQYNRKLVSKEQSVLSASLLMVQPSWTQPVLGDPALAEELD